MKVIGIGTNKSGTISMTQALQQRGLRVLHDYDTGLKIVRAIEAGVIPPEWDQYDVFLDAPFYLVAHKLLDRFPDTKFLYHWRPLEELINSSLVHVLDLRLNYPEEGWHDIDTVNVAETWRAARSVFEQLGRVAPAQVDEYRLGNKEQWIAFCHSIGVEPIELPKSNTSRQRLASIQAHYLSKGLTESTLPVVLAVRNRVAWSKDNNPCDTRGSKQFRENVERFWAATFKMPYFEYRRRLSEIAKENWARIEGLDSIVCAQTWPIESFAGAAVIPIDDDDWLRADLISVLRDYLPVADAAIAWKVDRLSPVGYSQYTSDIRGSAGHFATNGYALLPGFRKYKRGKEYVSAVFGHAQAAPDSPVTFVNEVLGIAPRTLASITSIKQAQSLSEFQSFALKMRDHTLPTSSQLNGPFTNEVRQLANVDEELLGSLRI